jgi:hypothetical protein
MKQIVLNHKTGFINLIPSRPIIIRDYRGKMFYTTEKLEKPVEKFNLPAGQYTLIEGNIKPLPKPVEFKLSVMPKPERNYPNPLGFKIEFGINPNKCSIIWRKKMILFDSKLKDFTLPEIYFILYHEYGHQLYHTEKYADLFSTNMMLKKGYNDSQIGAAPINSLSGHQIERKRFITRQILKRQRKRLKK